jgi:autotransporter adhesin
MGPSISLRWARSAAITAAIFVFFGVVPADAQFVCEGVNGDGQNAIASQVEAVACGTDAAATGFQSTAFGSNSAASDTAAVAIGANSRATDQSTTAVGGFSDARGMYSTAIGSSADAIGAFSVAVGANAEATSDGAVAMGYEAKATSLNATAIGMNATASHANSAAFGNGAVTTRDNQQVFGTASNTYTMSGIASAASRTAQGTATHLVTSNANGDLAAYTFAELGLASSGDLAAINSRLDSLNSRISDVDSRMRTGVAMAIAMGGAPGLAAHEKFAVTMNWGTFEGANGTAINAALRLADNIQLNAGFGYGPDEKIAAGRAGVRFAW